MLYLPPFAQQNHQLLCQHVVVRIHAAPEEIKGYKVQASPYVVYES
jgi:hypothetical protein